MNSQHVLESVNLAIAADSIDTANDKRDQHLKSPDFFNVRQHPQITFASSKVRQTGDGQFDVTGKLTLHGRTKQITIPVQFVGAGRMRSTKLTGVHAEFTIHRSDFGMTWGIDKGVVGDKVHMQVSLEGKKQ
jgi:polyisoprenoid-binding protein YceI